MVRRERVVELADVLVLAPVRYPVDDLPEVLVAHLLAIGQLGHGDDPDVVSEGPPKVLQVKNGREVAAWQETGSGNGYCLRGKK